MWPTTPTLECPFLHESLRYPFMTVAAAADYSGLPRSYLRELIKKGDIGIKTGAGWRIRRADLEKL